MNVSNRQSQVLGGRTRGSVVDKQGDVNMNELSEDNGYISLSVVLPSREVQELDVKSDTPMMDLLVSITSSNKLKPGEHSLSVVSEDTGRTINYKSSQSIGSLGVNRVFLISKVLQKMERETQIQKQKDASKFEQTIRVTINLPRGVKSLQRLNPHLPIMDIFRKICIEKGLDPSRYEVRLTKQANAPVDMSQSLSNYQTNEITIVQCSDDIDSAPDFHTSMIDISRAGGSKNTLAFNGAAKMSEPFEKVKKKRGLFSFLRKDKSKSKYNREQPGSSSQINQALPQNGDLILSHKPQAQIRPQPKQQTITEEAENEEAIRREKAKRAPSKKKYKAPAPPARPLSTMEVISEERKTTMYASTPNLISPPTALTNEKPRKKPAADGRNHSRNSSDSSGYHEPPVTPPDSASPPSTIDTSSLPRSAKKDTSGGPTAVKQKAPSAVQRSQTLPTGVTAVSVPTAAAPKRTTKKKAAPAPPPLQPLHTIAKNDTAPAQLTLTDRIVESEDETASMSSHNDDAPEMGIASFSPKSAPPPIFIPPPPPQTPPPPAVSESAQREPSLGFGSPTSLPDELSKSPVPLHSRSESRCSRASVDTIDDVQQYFDLAIAAGEKQLRSEQGATSPLVIEEEASKVSEGVSTLTSQLDKEPAERPVPAVRAPPVKPMDPVESVTVDAMDTVGPEASSKEPSKDDILAAVTQIDASLGEDDGSDGSLVPDGENFVVAASKLPSGGQMDVEDDTNVKPVEEISYGFDNPFKNDVPQVSLGSPSKESAGKDSLSKETLARRDSQQSDSTLPDSEHTDRPLSSSLQSSTLQSDEESVTETGDGNETTGTEKASQSETDTSIVVSDSTPSVGTSKPKPTKRGMFIEAKGQDVNNLIYGESAQGSIRGVPGQDSKDAEVKSRAASFTSKAGEGPGRPRPKSIFSIISSQNLTADPPKRRPASVIVAGTEEPPAVASKPAVVKESTAGSTTLYSRPLPVYNRMNKAADNRPADDGLAKGKPTSSSVVDKPADRTQVTSPTSGEVRPLASVLADSMRSGEAVKSMRRQPETASKPMFFKANRNSRVEVPKSPDSIENVVKLDTSKFEVKTSSSSLPTSESPAQKIPPPTAAKPNKPGANLNRKGSMKEQYNILQENMARWQDKLKANENRVKELTTSQKDLSTAGLQTEPRPVVGGMVKSTSVSESFSKRPFAAADDTTSSSVPSELHKVTLRSAANRVINKLEPELDPVETLMKTIRDRAGRTSDHAPDRGIYVASGEREVVPESVAQREVAPSVLNGIPQPPPPAPVPPKPTTTSHSPRNPSQKLRNGTDKSNDPRFNRPVSARDSLLAEIASAKGKPNYGRRTPADSSSQSSSDELREIEVVRHKPQKTHRHKNSKRSVSDPFPPQGPNSRHHIQDGNATPPAVDNSDTINKTPRPTPTQLDPREELMIAIRGSGGLSKLRQVNADEINWSAHV